MRNVPDPECTWDIEEINEIKPEPWMLKLLGYNPEYTSWGPEEDYMATRGHGWDSRQFFSSWSDFGPWHLNELNECVNFYFEVNKGPCVSLVLWWTHPRKGCSRGLMVNNIQESELVSVFAFLKEAAKRNAERFGRIP